MGTSGFDRVISLASLAMFAAGCSNSSSSSNAHLPTLNDLTSAPPVIQTAAQAIVRVETAGEAATGSFISPTGLLLTNNHVLGAPICPLEGCSTQITFLHQRGQAPQKPMDVFAVPKFVDIGLDMAVLQILASPGDATGVPLQTPNYLTIVSHTPESLQGTQVTIVGHPESYLKKWASGVVYDAFGSWFSSSAYILPGDSGSPVLDDTGALVGIIHRSPTGEDLVSSEGVNIYSIGTASAPLLAAMNTPLPSAMISTIAETTDGAVTANDFVYLNGRAANADVGGTPTSVLSLLGQACDAALAVTDYESIDALANAVAPCDDAIAWIECRADMVPPPDYGTVCPTGADNAAWASRFQSVNARFVAMNGNTDLTPVTFGVASLASSVSAGIAAAQAGETQALAAAGQDLDYGVAVYLAAFQVASYEGTNIAQYVRDYASTPDYPLLATDVAYATVWLGNSGAFDETDTFSILAGLHDDPKVSLGTKLYIEEVQYNSGMLK